MNFELVVGTDDHVAVKRAVDKLKFSELPGVVRVFVTDRTWGDPDFGTMVDMRVDLSGVDERTYKLALADRLMRELQVRVVLDVDYDNDRTDVRIPAAKLGA